MFKAGDLASFDVSFFVILRLKPYDKVDLLWLSHDGKDLAVLTNRNIDLLHFACMSFGGPVNVQRR